MRIRRLFDLRFRDSQEGTVIKTYFPMPTLSCHLFDGDSQNAVRHSEHAAERGQAGVFAVRQL